MQMLVPKEDARTKREISGKKLRALRESIPMSRETLAAAMGAPSINNLKRVETLDSAMVFADTFRQMAAAFGKSEIDFEKTVRPHSPAEDLSSSAVDQPPASFPADAPTKIKIKPPVPEFEGLDVAASHFKDGDTEGLVSGDDIVVRGHFRIRINGDCMAPDFQSSDVVEFELRPPGSLEPGQNCYVQTEDGATFKRVLRTDRGLITIGCINGQPQQWTLRVEDITQAAVAIWKGQRVD